MKWSSLLLISCIAMFGMHFTGVLVGNAFQFIISEFFLKIISSIMFLGFGVTILYDGFTNDDDENLCDKYSEAESEVKTKEKNHKRNDLDNKATVSHGIISDFVAFLKSVLTSHSIRVILLIIAEEMGDRSQITAIALSSTYSFYIVAIGGVIGHFFAI